MHEHPDHLFPYESLELLDIFLSKAPIGFALIDRSKRFTHINQHFATDINGLSIEVHIGKTIVSVLGSTGWKMMKPHFEKALKGEIIRDVELSGLRTQTGVYRLYTLASYFPIRIDGIIQGVGVIVRDVTQQKEAELALSQYKDRLEQAQKAGGVGVFDWNMLTNEIWWSDEEEALFGVHPGKFKGTLKDWFKSVHSDDLPNLKKKIKEAVDQKKDLDTEFRVIYPGKIVHWIRGRGHIYFFKDKPTRMIGVNFDITGRKNDEQLLQFKAESVRILASNLDYKKTLTNLAQLAIRYVADWCSVDMVNEDTGEVELLAVAHSNPAKVEWARKLREQNKVDMTQETGLAAVLKTGKAEFYPFITSEMIEAAARNKRELALIKKLGFTSIMIVPILSSGKPIGTITFVSSESKRHYTEVEFQMADQLASRAGLAIENARLYETVKAEHERLDDLLENVPGVVWESELDPISGDLKVNFVSEHAERLLGYKREDWFKKPHFSSSIIHPEDRERANGELQNIFQSGHGGVSRFRWVAKDGRVIWVEVQSFVIKDSLDNPIGMRGITLDISESMENVRRKDEFISMASHELKTPITSIKAFTQILKNTKDTHKQLAYLQKMEGQIERLSRLVFDLLDVSKIHDGKLELRNELFSLNTLITESVANLQLVNPQHKLVSKLEGEVLITGDSDRIEQVITNLITNAIKYSPEDNKVLIKLRKNLTHAIVSVRDYGVGIAPEHQAKIFGRYYRIHNTFSTPGLGIGLFISNEIIKRHGGTIWVQSKSGSGSTFFFTLPLSK